MKFLFPMLALLATAPLSARAGLNDGLLIWYDFGPAEAGRITDKSGHGHDATVVGAKWEAAGVDGGCYHFLRQGDLIETEDAGLPMGDAPRSVSWWFSLDRLRADPVATDMINYGTFSDKHCFALSVDWRIGRDCVSVSPWGWVALSRVRIERTEEWHHMVLTYGGQGKFSFYMDGAECPTLNEVPIAIDTVAAGKFRVGGYSPSTHGLDGRIDEVRVYGRELTHRETQELFKQGAALVSKRPQSATPLAWSPGAPRATNLGTRTGSGAASAVVAPPDFAITRIGFSNAADGDQDVTLFYPGEKLFVTVQDVNLNPTDTNLHVRASVYQQSDQEGRADETVVLAPQTNGAFRGVLSLAKLQRGRAMIDVAAYDLRGRVLRLFRTSEIHLMPLAVPAASP